MCSGRVSAEMYSAPSIVMQTRGPDGALHIFDDFREGYAWLRSNTAEDAIIASWCGAYLGFQVACYQILAPFSTESAEPSTFITHILFRQLQIAQHPILWRLQLIASLAHGGL